MGKAIALSDSTKYERNTPAIGVFAAGDPRIDAESRQRCRNICEMVADVLAERVKLPDGSPVQGRLVADRSSTARSRPTSSPGSSRTPASTCSSARPTPGPSRSSA